MRSTPHKAEELYLSHHPTLGKDDGASKTAWIREAVGSVLPADRAARILEVGPGKGEALKLFSQEFGYSDVTGIDISPEVISVCSGIPSVTVTQISDLAEYSADRSDQFDLILMYHVLEHIPKSATIPSLVALHGSLKPGGVLVVCVPNAAAPIIGIEQQTFDFTHEVAFSPWSLEQVHRIAGFGRCEVRPLWPPRGGLGRTLQRMAQKTVIAIMRAYLRIFTGVPRPVLTHAIVCYAWK